MEDTRTAYISPVPAVAGPSKSSQFGSTTCQQARAKSSLSLSSQNRGPSASFVIPKTFFSSSVDGAAGSSFVGAPRLRSYRAVRPIPQVDMSRSVTIRNQAEAATAEKEETYEFQAETSRLMDIIIHSLYSNKDIFLREVISNASDALDKIRFLSSTNTGLLSEGESLKIQVKADKEAGTLTIQDNGVGMTKKELIENLGTIARSGTSKFIETLGSGQTDLNLIGKFGVGFYSVYLVADRVTVISKSAEEGKATVWESAADRTFTVRDLEGDEDIERGTKLVLHVKKENEDFLSDERLREIIKRYSEFINFPIELWSFKEVEVKDEVEDEEKKEGEEEKEQEKKPPKKTTEWYWQVLNENRPIWTRSPKDVTDEEYKDFYSAVFKDFFPPVAWTHFSAEGTVEFRSILYLPERPGFEPQDWMAKSNNMKLYVRRVFIADEFEDLMPRYLNFIKGVVDSEDLPLNVSREILQQSKVLRTIRSRLVRKAIDMIQSIADREDKKAYEGFFENYGRNVKLGIIEDTENRTQLSKLLRYNSTAASDSLTTLSEYVSRMKENQTKIYYMAGESLEAIKNAPFLEKLVSKGYEVLYFTDSIDEVMMNHLMEFDGKSFENVSRENLSLDEEDEDEKKAVEAAKGKFKELLEWMETHLKEKVKRVTVSSRVTESPAVLVTGQFGWSANMERIMKAQTLNDPSKFAFMTGQKTLEINPNHPLIGELDQRVRYQPRNKDTQDLCDLLYETALLTSGFSIDNQIDYANKVYRMLQLGFSGQSSAGLEDEDTATKVEAEVVDIDE